MGFKVDSWHWDKVLQFSYQYNCTSTTAAVPSWHEQEWHIFYLYQYYVRDPHNTTLYDMYSRTAVDY